MKRQALWPSMKEARILRDLLGLVDCVVPVRVVHKWSQTQKQQAEKWAAKSYLLASDNNARVPPRPPFLDKYANHEQRHGYPIMRQLMKRRVRRTKDIVIGARYTCKVRGKDAVVRVKEIDTTGYKYHSTARIECVQEGTGVAVVFRSPSRLLARLGEPSNVLQFTSKYYSRFIATAPKKPTLYNSAIMSYLQGDGFKRTYRSRHRDSGMVIYTKTTPERRLEVQLWTDGMYRISHYHHRQTLYGCMCTPPTEFRTVVELNIAIQKELTRTDHLILNTLST